MQEAQTLKKFSLQKKNVEEGSRCWSIYRIDLEDKD